MASLPHPGRDSNGEGGRRFVGKLSWIRVGFCWPLLPSNGTDQALSSSALLSRSQMETNAVLQRKADTGDADACFRFGYRLAFGRRSKQPPDWASVVRYWRVASKAGHVRAQFYLGTCYDAGRGVTRNIRVAHRLYLMAAESGHEVAQYNVAFNFREGQGCPKNLERAFEWMQRASQNGDIDACRDLGFAYHEGIGTPVDYERAAIWYRVAAQADDAKAQWNLGLCYQDGHGVKQSRRWARYWFAKAASNDNPSARTKLRQLVNDEE